MPCSHTLAIDQSSNNGTYRPQLHWHLSYTSCTFRHWVIYLQSTQSRLIQPMTSTHSHLGLSDWGSYEWMLKQRYNRVQHGLGYPYTRSNQAFPYEHQQLRKYCNILLQSIVLRPSLLEVQPISVLVIPYQPSAITYLQNGNDQYSSYNCR